MMKIGFIGAGRVGCSLGKYLKESAGEWELMGYYSRSIRSAGEAAKFTGSALYEQPEQLVTACEAVFITTPDSEIADVWEKLCSCKIVLKGKLFVHCSGALTSGVFASAQELGVTAAGLHPFYAVSDRYHSYETLADALFTLEGSGERLAEFAALLSASGLTIQRIDAASKTAYHAAASVGSNLMVGLAELAIELLVGCGFDRAHARMALRPLMQGNLDAVMEKDTVRALTGPAERADVATVGRHMQVLTGDDREIYRLLTKKITALAKQKNPGQDYGELDELLRSAGKEHMFYTDEQ